MSFLLDRTIWKKSRHYQFDWVRAAHLENRSLVLKKVKITGIWIHKIWCWQKKLKIKSMQHVLIVLMVNGQWFIVSYDSANKHHKSHRMQ